MSRFWRDSATTGLGLFLEACAFYMLFGIIGVVVAQTEAVPPFWLVFLALLWAFLLSFYVQTLRFTRSLRGMSGLGMSAVSILILANMNWGLGLLPVGQIINGDGGTAFGLVLTLAFLVLLWWRGGSLAQDDVTLDTVRGAFQWGLLVLFAAVLIDSLGSAGIVNGFLIVGFFGAALVGLSLARFSLESGGSQVMSMNWWLSIGVSTAVVLILGLLVSAAALGGLDDVTRLALRTVHTIGFWVLRPVLLALGYLVGLLVGLGNWISSMFGGGELEGLQQRLDEILQFNETMREESGNGGFPGALASLLRWMGFLVGAGLAGWLLYRLLGIRRLRQQPGEVEETRESLFSWSRANQDLTSMIGDWWSRLVTVGDRGRKAPLEPSNPQEFYYGLLTLAEGLDHPRQNWQTPKEHERTLGEVLPMSHVTPIVDSFQSAHYGQLEANEAEVEELRREWASITEFLWRRDRQGPQQ